MMEWDDIDYAFTFVSAERYGMNSAYVCVDTGEIYFRDAMGYIDELSELKQSKDFDVESCVPIPHANDLELGRDLIFEFVHEKLPNEVDQVYGMFRQRGAYSVFKSFLRSRNLLSQWHDFENARREAVIRQWCKENGIELTN